ncbi:uncharacterized protein [Clytia hemisphaerica]|uniref:uncharacterized protein n=1 Tax=Clytia hemisphaerica TaxID=252671 RepID=UPI0034D52FCF
MVHTVDVRRGRSGKMAAETSFEENLNNVTCRLTHVNIREEEIGCDSENVLSLIKERKNKKQGCDYEVLQKECLKKFELDEVRFKSSITNLINLGCIRESKRLGRVIFTLLQSEIPTPTLHDNQDEMFSDFLDFKLYVTETLSSLNERVEKQNSSLGMKDVVIKLLQQELNKTQESLKIALVHNTELSKNNQKIQHRTRETVIKNHKNDDAIYNKILDDIPLDTTVDSIPNSRDEHFTIQNQLTRFREKMRHDFASKKLSKEKSVNKGKGKSEKVVEKVIEKTADKSNKSDRREEVIVCGDSMLNNIVGNGLSNKNVKVTVRNFPGANSDDMIHHIRPLVKRKPKRIILHVGTNDLTSGCNTKENLDTIRNLINDHSPSTELVMSQVLVREDKPGMKSMVKGINTVIDKFCEENNLYMIDHKNIIPKMLSKRKLHLNGSGISCFAQNLKCFILENC